MEQRGDKGDKALRREIFKKLDLQQGKLKTIFVGEKEGHSYKNSAQIHGNSAESNYCILFQ